MIKRYKCVDSDEQKMLMEYIATNTTYKYYYCMDFGGDFEYIGYTVEEHYRTYPYIMANDGTRTRDGRLYIASSKKHLNDGRLYDTLNEFLGSIGCPTYKPKRYIPKH